MVRESKQLVDDLYLATLNKESKERRATLCCQPPFDI
jgi:hypothetical protein